MKLVNLNAKYYRPSYAHKYLYDSSVPLQLFTISKAANREVETRNNARKHLTMEHKEK